MKIRILWIFALVSAFLSVFGIGSNKYQVASAQETKDSVGGDGGSEPCIL